MNFASHTNEVIIHRCTTEYVNLCFPKKTSADTAVGWGDAPKRRKRSLGFFRDFVAAKKDFVRDIVDAKRQLWKEEKRIIRGFLGLQGKKWKKTKSSYTPNSIRPPPRPTPTLPPAPMPPAPPPPPPPPPAEPQRPSGDTAAGQCFCSAGQSCVLAPKRTCKWVVTNKTCKQVDSVLEDH